MSENFYLFLDGLSDNDKLFYILMDSYNKQSLNCSKKEEMDIISKIYENLINGKKQVNKVSIIKNIDNKFDEKLKEWVLSFSDEERENE